MFREASALQKLFFKEAKKKNVYLNEGMTR